MRLIGSDSQPEMTEVDVSPGAARDLERLTDFLLASDPANAAETTDLILGALATLREHPAIGRTVEQGLRELVISRGRTGLHNSTAQKKGHPKAPQFF